MARLSALVAAALVLLALSPLPPSARLESAIGGVVAPVSNAVRAAVRPAADVLLHAGQLHELSVENADLRGQLARTEADLAALREERVAVQQAAALITAVGGRADQFVAASVLARDPAPGRALLLLNRGAQDGVRVGQPVLGAGSTLVGIVAQVDDHRARVRLLTDRDSAITAVVQASRTPASLAGTGDGLRLDLVPYGGAVAVGDVVLSSALGGLLPPGLLAGHVTAVHAEPQDLFERITVEPLADFSRLEQVLVMTGFTPGTDLGAVATATSTTP